jgi:hypothetical protein
MRPSFAWPGWLGHIHLALLESEGDGERTYFRLFLPRGLDSFLGSQSAGSPAMANSRHRAIWLPLEHRAILRANSRLGGSITGKYGEACCLERRSFACSNEQNNNNVCQFQFDHIGGVFIYALRCYPSVYTQEYIFQPFYFAFLILIDFVATRQTDRRALNLF